MKKIMFVLSLIIMLSVGCCKDNSEPDGTAPDALIGTAWVGMNSAGLGLTVSFTTSAISTWTTQGVSSVVTASYIYSHPDVVFTFMDDIHDTWVVNGNTMHSSRGSILTKQ